jgi:hypothetical protein
VVVLSVVEMPRYMRCSGVLDCIITVSYDYGEVRFRCLLCEENVGRLVRVV